ncbi:F-box/kelch-repeat protein At1g57790-like [Musa acuminata AAA Group]|uniref:F-box/kelch-repeat protein At1g57790-like n=1 Tax=Musa acuminata AAA Group TaxID=214697 RepID=UPI0031D21DF5
MVGRPFKGEGEKRAKCTEEEGKEEERVDWSNLDMNILQLIADQLTVDIADYIHFHGVCKTWHAVNHHGRTHPPQLPWLLMRCDYDINRLIFYSFSDERFHSIRPPTNDEHIVGSCDGWLVLDHKTSRFLSLLNPLTGARIHLPALPSYLINIEDYYPSILKIAISSNPSMYDHDCIIVIISTLNDALFSIRLWEDDLWALLDDRSKYHDVTYFKGNLYAVDEIAQVFIFNSFFEKVAIVGPQW